MDLVQRQNTCSVSPFASLEDKILVEILCRLPCKSVYQFKCVSKRWFSVISDSYFIQRFRSNHPQPPPFALLIKFPDESNGQKDLKLLVNSKDSEFQSQDFSLSFLPCFRTNERDPAKVIASCNGLLLCCAVPEACPTVYYVGNPLTKQWFALPPVYHCSEEANTGLICKNNSNQYGYRVVCIVNCRCYDIDYSVVKIFSSETGRWQETIHRYQDEDFPRWFSLDSRAIVCEGMLCWWSLFGGGFVACDPYKGGNLRSFFDCYPEDCTVLGSEDEGHECPGLCKGRFCFGQLSSESLSDFENSFATLRVWHLEDCDRNKWCLKHEVRLNELKSEVTQLVEYAQSTGPLHPFRLQCFHPYNENIIYMSGPYCLVSCNMERKTLELVFEIPSDYGCLVYPFEHPWWPSPIPSSINLSDGHITSV